VTDSWRPVAGYEGLYSVSECGQVRSEGRTVTYSDVLGRTITRSYPIRLMAQSIDPAGYPYVQLSIGGKCTALRVHSLMLKSFVGPRPPGAHGRHLDDVKGNNTLANLAWGSPLENSRDKYRNGNGNQYLKRAIKEKI
jgi:hypothetical protein